MKNIKGELSSSEFQYKGTFREDAISGVGYYKESKGVEEYFGNWDCGKYNGFGYLIEYDD
jgi:hypothetical protein